MKIKASHLALLIPLVIFSSVLLTSVMGIWKTTTDKVPATIKEGEFAGQYDPADIRGSYTLADIAKSFQVPLEDLGIAFGVKEPANYATFQVKELEAIYAALAAEGKEVGTGSVRYFVALYKGLPLVLTEESYLPKTAVSVLKAKVKLSAEQISALDKLSVELPTASAAVANLPPTTQPAETVTAKVVKGSTTFKELLDWGVKQVDIEKVIAGPLPNTSQVIKDYATQKGVEFSTVKEPLQKLIDELGQK